MTDTFDIGQELSANIGDRTGAWRFVRSFAAGWVSPLAQGDGWAERDVDAAEVRLGLRLPAALREAYQLFGRRDDLTSNHDVLLSPTELYVDDRKEALVFRHENQGAASWGILLTELDNPDPAVVIKSDLADKQAERWEGWLDRLSLACIEIILSESLHAPENRCDFLTDLEEAGVTLLEQHYTRLPFPEYPTCETPLRTHWYSGPDVVLRDDDRTCLLARARTEEALDQVRDQLPGDWLNDYR